MRNKSTLGKKFNPEQSHALKAVIKESATKMALATSCEKNNYSFKNDFESIEKIRSEELQKHLVKYPPNPPNGKCKHALIYGVIIDNSFAPTLHEYNPLLKLPTETIYVWTGKKDSYSYLISEVSESVHILNNWRPFGHIIRYTSSLITSFEHELDTDYEWIYEFDNGKDLEKQDFLNEEWQVGGALKKLSFFEYSIEIMYLLYTNNCFYFAVQNLLAAAEIHWFCQICAFQKEEERMHPNHEPNIWEYASLIPKMEIAIVKATKAIEGILGQQGKDKDKARARWELSLNIDPDKPFSNTGLSYFEFHAYLIENIRNKVAHNLAAKPFLVSRQITIQVQTYAWEIVQGYFHKIKPNKEESIQFLNLNKELISRDKENFGTPFTI